MRPEKRPSRSWWMPSPEKAPLSCAPRSFLGLNVTIVGMSDVDSPKALRKRPCALSLLQTSQIPRHVIQRHTCRLHIPHIGHTPQLMLFSEVRALRDSSTLQTQIKVLAPYLQGLMICRYSAASRPTDAKRRYCRRLLIPEIRGFLIGEPSHANTCLLD